MNMQSNKKPILTFEKFIFKYNQETIFKIENRLDVYPGELIYISGPSGCGKSSLLAWIQKHIKNCRTQYLFQNPYTQCIAPTVKEEFVFTMENALKSHEYIQSQLNVWSQTFSFQKLLNENITKCSGGMRQRLLAASLLSVEPDILLLDEPSAFLDPEARKVFYKELLAYKKSNPSLSLILVEHKHQDFLHAVDKVWVFENRNVREISYNEYTNTSPEKLSSLHREIYTFSSRGDILHPVTLYRKGDIHCILGPNGSGKSYFLRKLAEHFEGNVAYVAQNPEAHFFLDTVHEEILFNAPKITDAEIQSHFQNFSLPLCSLHRSPFLLSEGEKRRFSILLAYLQNKNIYIYDEPTFGQDRQNELRILEHIKFLQAEGAVQIIVTHDADFAQQIATKLDRFEPYIPNISTKKDFWAHHALFSILLSFLSIAPFFLNWNFNPYSVFPWAWFSVFIVYYVLRGARFLRFVSVFSLSVFFNIPLLLSPLLFPSKFASVDEIFANFVRLFLFSSLSLLGALHFNYNQFLCFLMQKKILSPTLGHSLLLSMNALSLMIEEWTSICFNAKLRGLKKRHFFSLIFPVFVFSIRSAKRGALSLRSRGLHNGKIFFYNYGFSNLDSLSFLGFCLALITILFFVV